MPFAQSFYFTYFPSLSLKYTFSLSNREAKSVAKRRRLCISPAWSSPPSCDHSRAGPDDFTHHEGTHMYRPRLRTALLAVGTLLVTSGAVVADNCGGCGPAPCG